EPDGPLVGEVARFLQDQDWVGRVFAGADVALAGLPTASPARIAISMKADERPNPYGVQGHSRTVRDAFESKDATGFGQHGGLGRNEQSPFLFVAGSGFAPGIRRGPTSLVDIAPSVLEHLGLACDGLDGRPLPRAAV